MEEFIFALVLGPRLFCIILLMSSQWYYVSGKDRVGPVEKEQLAALVSENSLNGDSFVWRKGLESWQHLKDVAELAPLLAPPEPPPPPPPPPPTPLPIAKIDEPKFSWEQIEDNVQVVSIKIGADRGCPEAEYGPFTITALDKLFKENRINKKTFIYTPGMENWQFLGDTPLFARFSGESNSGIEESERRQGTRRPFVARLLFTDQDAIFEGVCRDISVGGLQILIANFPGTVGQSVNMNVHPDNSEHCFMATGKIVRLLDGGAGFSIRFDSLGPEAQSAINNYVSSIEKQ